MLRSPPLPQQPALKIDPPRTSEICIRDHSVVERRSGDCVSLADVGEGMLRTPHEAERPRIEKVEAPLDAVNSPWHPVTRRGP